MARIRQEPALDWAVTIRLPHDLEEQVREIAASRLVPPAVALRQLVKERLDELQRDDDAWAYTPEHIAAVEQAHAEARAGRVYTMSPVTLARLAANPNGVGELERLAVRAVSPLQADDGREA